MPTARAHQRSGFTLIEILMVVAVISILAAIAIPKFTQTKERAFLTEMRADLKNFAGAAEAYYVEQRTYVGFVGPDINSPGVTLTATLGVSGWSGHASHSGTAIVCDIQVGDQVTAPHDEGAPYCTP